MLDAVRPGEERFVEYSLAQGGGSDDDDSSAPAKTAPNATTARQA